MDTDILNILELDLFDPNDVLLPIDFRVNDVKNLDTRQGSNTKTLTVPGTKRNDSLLGYKFSENGETFFDDNKTTPAVIERDNVRYMEGSLQLFETKQRENIHAYDLVLYSENSDWFVKMGDKSIRDLDLGKITLNAATIKDSWTHTGDKDAYVFQLIDYGFFTDKDADDNIQLERLFPAIFDFFMLKTIAKDIGFTIVSTFFKRPEHRDSNILFTEPKVQVAESFLNEESAEVSVNTPYLLLDNKLIDDTFVFSKRIEYDNIVQDISENFNIALDQYEVPILGVYTARLTVTFEITIIAFTGEAILGVNSVIKTATRQSRSVEEIFGINAIGQKIEVTQQATFDIGNSLLSDINDFVSEIELDLTFLNTSVTFDLQVKESNFEITPTFFPYTEGIEIDLAKTLPDIKQKDFVKALFQRFNLISTTDNRRKVITIESEFYDTIDNAEDWTEFIDYSKEYTWKRIQEGLGKDLQFKYKTDSEDDNLNNFKENFGKDYANITIEMENEFLKDSKAIADLPYAATFMGDTFSDTLYMPLLINEENLDNKVAAGGDREITDWEPRTAYYNGLQQGNWKFEGEDLTTYPQAIFIKKDSGFKDVSLAFVSHKDISSSLQNDDIGLKDRHYNNLINTINNSRLLTIFLKLDATTISTLDFRKLKFLNINGERIYFTLNAIEDYIAGVNDSFETELIPVKPSITTAVQQAAITL
jgi:hypothetical protein